MKIQSHHRKDEMSSFWLLINCIVTVNMTVFSCVNLWKTPKHHCWNFGRRFDSAQGQWLFLVPLIGGRWYIYICLYIVTQLAVYTPYIPLTYCQLGWLYITYHLLREPSKQLLIGGAQEKGHQWQRALLLLQQMPCMGATRRKKREFSAKTTPKSQRYRERFSKKTRLNIWRCKKSLLRDSWFCRANSWGDSYAASCVVDEVPVISGSPSLEEWNNLRFVFSWYMDFFFINSHNQW